jgi:hypothetical protein
MADIILGDLVRYADYLDINNKYVFADMCDKMLVQYAQDISGAEEAQQENPYAPQPLKDEYDFPAWKLDRIAIKVEQLNKRAAKLGLPPIQIEVLEKYNRTKKDPVTEFERQVPYVKIKILGEPPKLGGWGFVGTVAHHPSGHNIIKGVPGYEVPPMYRERGNVCDHCGTVRPRNETMILVNDNGEYKQVGRSCLKDFLGHTDPRHHASLAESMQDLYADAGSDDDEDLYGRSRGDKNETMYISVEDFIALSAAYVRQHGYRSAVKAREDPDGGGSSSWDLKSILAGDDKGYYFDKSDKTKKSIGEKREQLFTSISPEDKATAEEAIEWIREMQQDESKMSRLTDYEYNIITAINTGVVDRHTFGLLMSVIPAFAKHSNRIREIKEKEQVGPDYASLGYAGDVGARIPLVVTVDRITPYEGAYGTTYIHALTDQDGRKITWFGSGNPLEIGRKYQMMAMVKNQKPANPNSTKPWERIPQTEIARPTKIVELESEGKTGAENAAKEKEEAEKQHFITKVVPQSREKLAKAIQELVATGEPLKPDYRGQLDVSWIMRDIIHSYVMYSVRALGKSASDAYHTKHPEDYLRSLEQDVYNNVIEKTIPLIDSILKQPGTNPEAKVNVILSAIDLYMNQSVKENT